MRSFFIFPFVFLFPALPASACPSCVDKAPKSLTDPTLGRPTRNLLLPSTVTLDWPVTETLVLNSPFGPRQLGSSSLRYDFHRGIDLTLPIGTPLVAPADAIVVFAGVHPNYTDPIIQLRHTSTMPYVYTLFSHISGWSVTAGQEVVAGEEIGLSGQGTASYPHLHWEVRLGCLRNECAENPYRYFAPTATGPVAPSLVAAGDSAALGRMVLVETEVPASEIDFESMRLQWGPADRTANLTAMNALSPLGEGSKLDDPLFHDELDGSAFAILPGRFNSSYSEAPYQVLFWHLDGGTSSGTATAGDAAGNLAPTALSLDLPPLSVAVNHAEVAFVPGAAVNLVHTVTNNDAVARTLNFSGLSAQSLSLGVSPASALVGPGANVQVTISATLDGSWPEDVGDIILLVTEMAGTSHDRYLSGTLLDTDPAGLPVVLDQFSVE